MERGDLDEAALDRLVAACRGGNRGALAELVDACARPVFALCLGIVGNAHDAEDLAQETLLRGLTRIGELRRSRDFRAWIASIARHLCLDHLRRQRIGREAVARHVASEGKDTEAYTALEQAIGRLSEEYRLPLVLFYFDGHSTKSVADLLNLKQAAVCTRLCRARKELRKLLSEQAETP